jgi:universal stress protein E
MPATRKILVAVKDPAAPYQPGVEKAARLAKGFGAKLELFHGITEPVLSETYLFANGELTRLRRETRARCIEKLEKLAAPLREGGLDVTVSADWDFPAHEAVVRQARRHKIDLIVAQCHEGKRTAPWLMHLTDWELLRTSPVPVLLVRSGGTYADVNVLAAIDPSHRFAKPAKLDSRILSAAVAYNTALKGTLHVVHSYLPLPASSIAMPGASALAIEQIAEGAEARARAAFKTAVAAYRLPQNRLHLVQGAPLDAIPRVAQEIRSGLVVMGAISRSGLQRVFIGNTAEQVLSALPCDVLVVKPLEFKTHVARRGRGIHFVGLPRVAMGM